MHAFYKLSWIPSLMVIAGLIFISSCKDDEKPKPKISFQSESSEVYENDGPIDIKIVLDKPASETLVISYTISGTATRFTSSGGDYEISPLGTVTIAKGDSEAEIEITPLEDDNLEVSFGEEITSSETVILTLTGIVSGPGQLGEEGLVHTLSIYEDDMLIILDWNRPGGNNDDTDMDLWAWYNHPENGFQLVPPEIVGNGATTGNEAEALLFLGGLSDYEFGFSYVYYSGTNDDLDLASLIINFGGTISGNATEFITEDNFVEAVTVAKYSLANLNEYDNPDTGQPIEIVQTVKKSGLNYTNLSGINVPESGSRQRIVFGNLGNTDISTIRSNQGIRKITLPKKHVEGLKKYYKIK